MRDHKYTFTAARMHAEGTITYGAPTAGVRATGTVTIVQFGNLAGKTVTVDGNVLTEGADWTAATANSNTATSLAAAIDALAGFSAAAVGAVVTITYDTHGTAGNAKAISTNGTSPTDILLSGATLSGGVAGDTVVVNGTTFTCVDAGATGNQFTSAATLATLINALANINAANSSGTITIKADAVGTTGNTYTLALGGSNTGTLAISGATLTGGAAALYTDAFDLEGEDDSYEVIVAVTALGGGSPTADFTPEGSTDGGTTYYTEEGEDESPLAMTQFTSTGTDKQYVKLASPRNRLKLVLGGTSPTITGTVTFIGRND